MPLAAARLLAQLLAAYVVIGLAFAVPFALRWAGRLDPAASSGTAGFRLLIIPGAVLLWPWLAARLLRRPAGEPR
jgi:hypothetical protein